MTLSQMLAELAKIEATLNDLNVIDNIRPIPWRYCTHGCGCRYGTMDADARECACSGPCCGGDDDTWFSEPFNQLGDTVIQALVTLIHLTHDTKQVGAILVDRLRATQLNVSREVALANKRARDYYPHSDAVQRAWQAAHIV